MTAPIEGNWLLDQVNTSSSMDIQRFAARVVTHALGAMAPHGVWIVGMDGESLMISDHLVHQILLPTLHLAFLKVSLLILGAACGFLT